MSVMRVSFHFNNTYIGDFIGLSMKILLSLIICSQVHMTCMPAYEWPEKFDTTYDCMTFGYEESLVKMKEIGRDEVNKHDIYIRFLCTPEETI
jgi:hypothetical protein